MAFRDVLVTGVFEVLRAWLAVQGTRAAAAHAEMNMKTVAWHIRPEQEWGWTATAVRPS